MCQTQSPVQQCLEGGPTKKLPDYEAGDPMKEQPCHGSRQVATAGHLLARMWASLVLPPSSMGGCSTKALITGWHLLRHPGPPLNYILASGKWTTISVLRSVTCIYQMPTMSRPRSLGEEGTVTVTFRLFLSHSLTQA